MSICTRITKYTGNALSALEAGVSWLCQSSLSGTGRIWKIGTSVLGKKAMLSIRENVAEFVAYYAGAELAAPYGKRVGSKAGAFAGATATAGLTIVTAHNVATYTQQYTTHLTRPIQHLISAAIITSIICCISNLTGESSQEIGAHVGGVLGEAIAYYGGGILAAFLAIKLTGSEEIFWQHSSKTRTYPVKTIVSMAGTAAINIRFPILQTRYVQPLTDLIIGSLIYNSLDLAETCIKIKQGKLLDGTLPKKLPALGYLDAAQLINRSIDSIVCKDGVFANCFIPDLMPHLRSFLKNLSNTHIHGKSPALDCLKDLTAQKASEAIMRGTNLYFEILQYHPDILDHAETFASFLEAIPSVLEQPLQSNLLQNYSAFRNHLLTQLFEKLTGTHFGPNLPSNLPKIPRFITSEHIDYLTEKYMKQVQSLEEASLGFPLSGEREREKIHAFLESHLENIVKCILLCTPIATIPLQDQEIRNFYTNLSEILAYHYTSVLGSTLSAGITAFLKHQASNSDLA